MQGKPWREKKEYRKHDAIRTTRRHKPKNFIKPAEFYLVKGKSGYFISYRQGWAGVFYAPEEEGE